MVYIDIKVKSSISIVASMVFAASFLLGNFKFIPAAAAQETLVNLATLASTTASGGGTYNTNELNYPRDGLVDGNNWAGYLTDGAWYEYDFGKAYTIRKVELVTRQVSNDPDVHRQNWEIIGYKDPRDAGTVLGAQGTPPVPAMSTWTLNVAGGAKYRYIRMHKTAGPEEDMAIAEFRVFTYASELAASVNVYVSPNGNDSNDGTLEHPFATIQRARDYVRGINAAMTSDILVYLRGGVYNVTSTIAFDPSDSGTNGYNIIYMAYPGETPVIDGGRKITGWSKIPGSSVWKASVGGLRNFRQFYVNGKRAERAASPVKLQGTGWYDDTSTAYAKDGIIVKSAMLPHDFANASGLELVMPISWICNRVPVDRMMAGPAADETTIVLKQPYFNWLMTATDNAAVVPTLDRYFYLENAAELLDNPGEWHYDSTSATLYYYPRPGEDMKNAEAYVPQTEVLMTLKGTSLNNKIHNLRFQGLQFRHGSWLLPSKQGIFPYQAENLKGQVSGDDAGMIPIIDSPGQHIVRYILPAQIQVDTADSIAFEDNVIQHMGSCGIGLYNSVSNTTIRGNVIADMSGAAITVGSWTHAYPPPGIESCKNTVIDNNLIRKTGVEYWSSPAISAYYVEAAQITHNDIADCGYSGIAVGWGWGSTPSSTTCKNNTVTNNKIANFCTLAGDGGGIYMLGQQPGSAYSSNYLVKNNRNKGSIYPDAGSAQLTINNNVVEDASKWLDLYSSESHDITVTGNYTTTSLANTTGGANCSVTGTTVVSGGVWPAAAQQIINSAGLTSEYAGLLANYGETNTVLGMFDLNNAWSPLNGSFIVKLQDYDTGGEGVGYHDSTPDNRGDLFSKSGGVDIYDTGMDIEIGSFAKGEWLLYTRDIGNLSNYDVYIRYQYPTSAVRLYCDNVRQGSDVALAALPGGATSAIQYLTTISNLSPGRHSFKLYNNGGAFGCDTLYFIQKSAKPIINPIKVNSLDFKDGAGENSIVALDGRQTVQACAVLQNQTAETKQAMLAVGVYSGNRLLEIKFSAITQAPNSQQSYSIPVDVPQNQTNISIKAMVWENFVTAAPYIESKSIQ